MFWVLYGSGSALITLGVGIKTSEPTSALITAGMLFIIAAIIAKVDTPKG